MASASTEEMRKAAKDVQDRGKQQEDGFKSPADLEGALPSVSLARGCPCRAWCGASSHALGSPAAPNAALRGDADINTAMLANGNANIGTAPGRLGT